MALFSKIKQAWDSTKLYGKTFVSSNQLEIGADDSTKQITREYHLEFHKDYLIMKNIRKREAGKIMWKYLEHDNDTYTFRDEKYGQWLISKHHVTYTDIESHRSLVFVGTIL